MSRKVLIRMFTQHPFTQRLLLLVFGATLTPLAIALPALAGWEYTNWGMTVAEVQQASGGRAKPVSPPPATPSNTVQRPLLQDQWTLDGFTFNVLFEFSGENPQLTEVILTSTGNNQDILLPLMRKYGRPAYLTGGFQNRQQASRFSLIQGENYAISGNQPLVLNRPASLSELIGTAQWQTPTDYIFFERTNPQEVVVRFQPR